MLTNVFDLRAIRYSRKLTIAELAKVTGIDQGLIKQCERRLVKPDKNFWIAVGSALSVDSDALQKSYLSDDSIVAGEGYITARADKKFLIEQALNPSVGSLKVVDLFCGIGGFSHGFELIPEFEVIAGIDLLPDRVQTFSMNHPKARAYCEDIRSVKIDDLSGRFDPDLVIGGPPCQGFSSLRPFRTLTENDNRNSLFEQFAVALHKLKPKWFVFENVVGLISHRGGSDLKKILQALSSEGYSVDWRVLNAVYYGLPQRRERLIIVGNRIGKKFRWPEPKFSYEGRSMAGKKFAQSNHSDLFSPNGTVLSTATTVWDAISDLPVVQSGTSSYTYKKNYPKHWFIERMRGANDHLTMHDSTKHSPKMLDIIRHAGSNISSIPTGLVRSGFSTSYSRLEPTEPSVTLTVNFVHPASNKCVHPFQDRALTPREGARLQGFEDTFVFSGNRSQVVKQIGNAVPPLLGQVLAESILAS